MNGVRLPMILGGDNIAQEGGKEIEWLTQNFKKHVELIRQAENFKSELENMVRLLVSMTKWLGGKHRFGTTMLSLSMDQVHLLESHTQALLDESIIREMGTSRLEKKMANLQYEERMLIANFNNLLKECIKFDEKIESSFRQYRAARAVEVAYSMQNTCNSQKLQSLNYAMHALSREENTTQYLSRHVAAQLVCIQQDHDLAHFSASLAEKIFLKELKNLAMTKKSLSWGMEEVHALQASNKKKLIKFVMLSNLLSQIDDENDYIFRLLHNMDHIYQYNGKSIMLLDKISSCYDRVRVPFSIGKKHGLWGSQLGSIQHLLGRIRTSLKNGDIMNAYNVHEKLHGTLKLVKILCFLSQEYQNNVLKRENMRQQLVEGLDALGAKEAECRKKKKSFNQLHYEIDRYQVKAGYEAARFLTMSQATLNTKKTNEKRVSLYQKAINRVEEDIKCLMKSKLTTRKALGDARKAIKRLKCRIKKQEHILQDPGNMEVSVDTCEDKMKKKSTFAQTSKTNVILESRAYTLCALALEEATFQDK
eukprot:jgi/Picsp_1/6596/NSC_03939-R1_---NA---